MKKRLISILVASMMMLSLINTFVSADAFELGRNLIVTASDLPTYSTVDSFGKTGVMQFANTSAVGTKAIRYNNLNMSADYSGTNRYLLVDCYLDDSGVTDFNLSVTFRSTYGNDDSDNWGTIYTKSFKQQQSSNYEANKWVTVAMDCKPALEYLASGGYKLKQLQINIPSTIGNFYVGDVRFTDSYNVGPFIVDKTKIMTASDLPTYTTADFSGKTSVLKFADTSAVGTKAIRYEGLNMSTLYSASNKTLLVDCYLEDTSKSNFDLSVVFRKTTDGKWITNIAEGKIHTRTSENYYANKWVTVAIDCKETLAYLVANNFAIDQMQINIPATVGNFYVGNIRFTNDDITDDDIFVKSTSFVLENAKILSDEGYTPYTNDVEFAGKTGVLKFENTNGESRIRYSGIAMSPDDSKKNRYLVVDCYLEDLSKNKFDLSAVFRKTTNEKWLTNIVPEISTRKSDEYDTNKWVSVIIDCKPPLRYLEANNYTLDQFQINLPTTTGNFYIGNVRFADYIESVNLCDSSGKKCNWQNGTLKVKVDFSNEFSFELESLTAYAVVYKKQNGKLVATAIQSITKKVNNDDILEIPVNILDKDNSFMKVFILDRENKALCDAVIFGTDLETITSPDTTGVKEFMIDKPVIDNDRNITITGADGGNAPATFIVLVKNEDKVLYVNEQKVQRTEEQNKKFNFEFNANLTNNSDMENYSGMYDVYVYSDYSNAVEKTRLGIPYNQFYSDYIALINEITDPTAISTEHTQRALKCYSKYMLPANYSGTNFYVDDILNDTTGNISIKVLETLVREKPIEGYDGVGFETIFNKTVAKVVFDTAEGNKKFSVLDGEYGDMLGTTDITQTKAYKLLAVSDSNKNKIFEGIVSTDMDFLNKLKEKVVVGALNACQNALQIKEIVEEEKAKLGISLSGKYEGLPYLKQMAIFENMLPKNEDQYTDYESVAAMFNSGLNKIESLSVGGGNGGGGNGGGSFPISVSSVGDVPIVQTVRFADVENLTWGKIEIETLANQGIISGMTNDEFCPDTFITREQFCRLIAVAFNITGNNKIPFRDVDTNAWYARSVQALYTNDYISGETEESFGIGKNITREDAAVILYRVVYGKNLSTIENIDFTDAMNISDYARDAVLAMTFDGILNGYDDNTFGPHKNITRREAAIILYRALNLNR